MFRFLSTDIELFARRSVSTFNALLRIAFPCWSQLRQRHPIQFSASLLTSVEFLQNFCRGNFSSAAVESLTYAGLLHFIQSPCYRRRSPCQDSQGNRTTRRPPDHRKETQTAAVWTSLPFIRSGQKHLARHSERGKKIRRTEEQVGRQHQGMVRPGVRQVPEGSEEQRKLEETGCGVISGTPTTPAVMD